MLKKITILVLIGALVPAVMSGTDLDEAVAASKKDGKPVLIDFYAVWCGPCKVFTRESKTKKEIKAALDKVHLVKLDAEHDGKEIADRFEIKGFPTFVLVNGKEQSFYRWWGYETSDFLKNFNKGMSDQTPYEKRLVRYAREKGLADGMALTKYYQTRGQTDETLALYEELLKHHPDAPVRYDLLMTKFQASLEGKVSFDEMDTLAVKLLDSDELEGSQSVGVAEMMFDAAKRENKTDVYGRYLEAGIKEARANISEENMADRLERMLAHKALFVNKDAKAAVKHFKASLADDWDETASGLNNFGWWCFENNINLKEARDMAKKGVSLSENGMAKAMVLDTLAEIENALGNPAEAARIMEQAIKEDDRESYKKQLERFRKLSRENTGSGSGR